MTKRDTDKSVIIKHIPWDPYKSFIKSMLDRLLAFIALVALSPILMITALAIKLNTRGPVFFIQERLGRFGTKFRIFKFRSMVINNLEKSENKLFENDPRITRVGGFIRKTSIDELPQLINILRGEMSFIGPRPPVPYFPKEIIKYTEYEYQRFLVKPGISGLAQVRCREVHDWNINIPIDVEYVHNFSFLYDLKLLVKSLKAFVKTDNVYRQE